MKQQAIFELLGPTFVRVYFPYHEVESEIRKQVEAAGHLLSCLAQPLSESTFLIMR
jgi:hypothetical protein